MRHIVLLTCLVVACSSRPATKYQPAMYPYPDFGRAGCFAGPSLARFVDASGPPGAEAITRGPWLVLDSLVGIDTAWRRNGEPATLVQRKDSVFSYWGNWHRIAGDSISIDEGTFPPVNWRLRVEPHQLKGEAILQSDVSVNGRQAVRRWSVWLQRIPCSSVPVTAPPI